MKSFLIVVALIFLSGALAHGAGRKECREAGSPALCANLNTFISQVEATCNPAKTDQEIAVALDEASEPFQQYLRSLEERGCFDLALELETAANEFKASSRKIAWGSRSDHWRNNQDAQANWRAGLNRARTKLLEHCRDKADMK